MNEVVIKCYEFDLVRTIASRIRLDSFIETKRKPNNCTQQLVLRGLKEQKLGPPPHFLCSVIGSSLVDSLSLPFLRQLVAAQAVLDLWPEDERDVKLWATSPRGVWIIASHLSWRMCQHQADALAEDVFTVFTICKQLVFFDSERQDSRRKDDTPVNIRQEITQTFGMV